MKNIPGGLVPKDEELCEQMDACTMSMGMRWEVEKGHDDVLVCFMLAVVAAAQWPPPNVMSFKHNVMETNADRSSEAVRALRPQPSLDTALQRDLREIFHPGKAKVQAATSRGYKGGDGTILGGI
jgi:hypothetical protein